MASGVAACGSTPPIVESDILQVRSNARRDENPALQVTDYATFVDGTNDLGFEVFHRAATPDENAISLLLALPSPWR